MAETNKDSELSSTAFTTSLLDKKGRTTLAESSCEIDVENLKKLKQQKKSLFSDELEKYVETIMIPLYTKLSEKDDRGVIAKRVQELLGEVFVTEDDNHPLKEFLKNSYDQAVSRLKNKSQVTVSVQGDERELWISYEDNVGGFTNEFIAKAKKDSEAVTSNFKQGNDVSYEKFFSQEDSKESLRKSGIESDKSIDSDESSESDLSGGWGWGLALRYQSAKDKGGDLLVRNKIHENEVLGAVITIRVPLEMTPTQPGRRRIIGDEGFKAAMQEPLSLSTGLRGLLKLDLSGDSQGPSSRLKISRSRDIFLPTPTLNSGTASTVTSITVDTTSSTTVEAEEVSQSPS